MKTRYLLLLVTFFSSVALIQAQSVLHMPGSEYCYKHKLTMDQHTLAGMKSAGSPVHAFDVKKYTLELDLTANFASPFPKSFGADEKISFQVDSALNSIVLNAVNNSLLIDSVGLAGISFTHEQDRLTIYLDRPYSPGEMAEVKISYHHKNVSDGAVYVSGGFFFTDCEPEGARKWYPCYDHPSDKALLDLTATVPASVKLGSNGHLEDSIPGTNSITYHWVTRDPVSTYLVVISAKVNYNLDIVNWVSPVSGDTVPFRFYFNSNEDPTEIENIIGEMTTFYSDEFGDHPFEKNGFASLNNQFAWGGMENQTLTSICPGCWDEWLIAHEFAHQWFGDMITCATWADIFLNEGFATWSEAHWTEHKYGYAAYKSEMNSNAQYYIMGNPGWPISDPSWAVNTPNVNVLFDYSITYMKGSCVLHQLRYVLGDSLFFAGIKAYAADTVNFKYGSSTIPDFRDKMEEISQQDLNWFFDEWIYQPNHPVYDNVYSIHDNGAGSWQVYFTARQTEASTYYWQMPLELRIRFSDLTDTLIRVFNSFDGQIFSFQFNKEPVQLVFDPDNDIILKEGNTVVGVAEDQAAGADFWVSKIAGSSDVRLNFRLQRNTSVSADLFDMTGRRVSGFSKDNLAAGCQTWDIATGSLKPGVYMVMIHTPEMSKAVRFIIEN